MNWKNINKYILSYIYWYAAAHGVTVRHSLVTEQQQYIVFDTKSQN